MTKMTFSAPWGLRVTLMTSITLVIFLGPLVALLLAGILKNAGLAILAGTLLVLCIVFLLVVRRTYHIKGYSISREGLVILRAGEDLHFDLSSLESAEIDPHALRGTYKATNGGLFSIGGGFCQNRKLGLFEAYASDPRRSVVLRFPDLCLVVTPDNPRAFRDALREMRILV